MKVTNEKLHAEALSIFAKLKPTQPEQKARETASGYNQRRRAETERLRPVIAEMQARFEKGESIASCNSLKDYCKRFREQGCLTYARCRQIITGKSGNENKVKSPRSLDPVVDLRDGMVVRWLGATYKVRSVGVGKDDDETSLQLLVEQHEEPLPKKKKPTKKTHVLGLQRPTFTNSERETACGLDSNVGDVLLVESNPTCKKCQAGARLRGTVTVAPKPLTHAPKSKSGSAGLYALCDGRKLNFEEVAEGGTVCNPTCERCKQIRAKSTEKFEREMREDGKKDYEVIVSDASNPDVPLVVVPLHAKNIKAAAAQWSRRNYNMASLDDLRKIGLTEEQIESVKQFSIRVTKAETKPTEEKRQQILEGLLEAAKEQEKTLRRIKSTVGACPITDEKYAARLCDGLTENYLATDGMWHDSATLGADGFWRFRCRQGIYYVGDGLQGQPHLAYAEDGKVLGYIYYNEIEYADDEAGCFTIVVHPKHRRRGIGTKLLIAGQKEWGIDLEKQQYTRAGAALVRSFLKKPTLDIVLKEECSTEETQQ